MVCGKGKKTYELRLEFSKGVSGQAELLRCVLTGCGIPEGEIVEAEQDARVRLSFYTDSRPQAQLLRRKAAGLGLQGVTVSFIPIETRDWQTRWKEDFKPFPVTADLYVVPLWMKRSWKKKGTPAIFIDTDTVFGTGMHPTTRFMAEFIRSKRGRIADFLDIGTGTGILALVARHYGVRKITGIDIKEEAVRTAKRNFKNNACSPEYVKAADFNRFSLKAQFDFVAANLFTDDLIRMRSRLLACVRPGKYLAVSGISLENYSRFREKFDTPGLRCAGVIKKNGWAAVLYKVKKGGECEKGNTDKLR
ncbi:MAG: 50S ribosomal protein L11 methyltransferase [Candidatus Omnitrophica bacterium]|nr:50S ribosomal protein L11 methyltransferase [Candidatus Omnitrophota bacterium]